MQHKILTKFDLTTLMLETVTDIPPFRTYRPYQTKSVKSYARHRYARRNQLFGLCFNFNNVTIAQLVYMILHTSSFTVTIFHNIKAQN